MKTIRYEVVPEADPMVEVSGDEVRQIRKESGFAKQKDFAEACEWSKQEQHKYERPGRVLCRLSKILKMIRVCNGSE